MESLSCTFCTSSESVEKPRFTDVSLGNLLLLHGSASLTCPRCCLPSYCSKYCGFQAAQAHDMLCVDVATASGAAAAAADAALAAAVDTEASSEEYERLAAAEAKIYTELYHGKLEYETLASRTCFSLEKEAPTAAWCGAGPRRA